MRAAWQQLVASVGKNTLWGLAVLMLAGLLLRCWGLAFGLPNDSRPDEYNSIQVIVENLMTPMVTRGDFSLNPHFFRYPSLYFYAMLPFYFIFYWWLKTQGFPPMWQEFLVFWQSEPAPFHLILRWASVITGTLMIPAMFGLAMQVLKDKPFQREVAWLSAILMAACYLMVRVSHFGGVDMPMALFSLLALIAIIHFDRVRDARARYIACGLIGMATGIKYPAAVLCLPLWVALFRPYCDTQADRIDWGGFFTEAFKTTGMVILAFLLTSPWIVLDVNKFWFDFNYEATHYFGFMMPGLSSGWIFYLTFALFYGVGVWVLAFALLGLVRSLKYDKEYSHWILLAAFVAFYVLLGTNYRVLTRYALPLVPIIVLYSAIGIRDAASWIAPIVAQLLSSRWQAHKFLLTFIVLALVVVSPTLITSLKFDAVLNQPDTRVLAREWLGQTIQHPQPVAVGPRLGQIRLPVSLGQLVIETGPNNMSGRPPEKIEVVDMDARTKIINTYGDLNTLRQLGIRYVVMYGGMPLFSNPPWEFDVMSREAKSVFTSSPLKVNADVEKDMGRFDVLDAFYLPYDKFDAFERPGPNIVIYDIVGNLPLEQPDNVLREIRPN